MQRNSSIAPIEKKERPCIGPSRLTKYEKARIIGAVALQLSMGAPILIELPPGVKDPISIAELELEKGVLPIMIRRSLPDGRHQDIPVKWLVK